MGRLNNKVAIVTGAGSGMGREEALLLAREGVKVVDEILSNGGQATSHFHTQHLKVQCVC